MYELVVRTAELKSMVFFWTLDPCTALLREVECIEACFFDVAPNMKSSFDLCFGCLTVRGHRVGSW